MNFETFMANRKGTNEVVIVGAGKRGSELISKLKAHGVIVNAIMDNCSSLWDTQIEGIKVGKVCNLNDRCIYIITPASTQNRENIIKQLKQLGAKDEQLLEYDDYDYYKTIYMLGECKEELSELYRKEFSRELDWENPKRYTEILNWEKLNINDPLKTLLADKVKAREWVSKKIGDKYLTKRYNEWKRVEDIDFESLPDQFVLKLNNGSGRNIIVEDKTKFDKNQAIDLLNVWLSQNYAFCNGGYEIQYKDIEPKIVCEEYLEGVADTVYDYNIYCFHGEPKYIWCIKGSHRPGCMASFYDKDWNMQEFSFGYPKDPVLAPRPEKLDEMLKLSKILCEGFEHVRVDWYNLPDGRVLFGEMTFTTWSGLRKFEPDRYDDIFGELIRQK